MSHLNEQYRKQTGTTDVLSFTLSEASSPVLEGEIYISLEQTERQVKELEVPLAEEIIRLVTHGMLHLTGRTHETEKDFKSYMEDTEQLMRRYYREESA